MTTTTTTTAPDLSAPIWGIEHIAAAFMISVDRARDYVLKPGFPAARQPGKRCLWLPSEVLAWFAALPAQTSNFERRHQSKPAPVAPVPAVKPYTPRARKAA